MLEVVMFPLAGLPDNSVEFSTLGVLFLGRLCSPDDCSI